ncbi:GNAT family N-acetyltransferase [Pontivivens ytuae]|uniref:GNAT family N-acetyltransferase n=1 Tax=Pontivivens ytuae TaxID=2789856 RepID=A0A7S9LUI6_9RHOB|nr:GNAT family N-acetyltransferase [Pontivivens ytuae]QPH55423.1 GNAT family N-acetyltransferase [Pontivivens ytuae]
MVPTVECAVWEDLPDILLLQQQTHDWHSRRFPEAFPPWELGRDMCLVALRKHFPRKWVVGPMRPSKSAFVIRDAGGVAGHCLTRLWTEPMHGRSVLYIEDITVRDTTRGQGLGQRLLDHAAAMAKVERCSGISATIWGGNEASRMLFERNGYGVVQMDMFRSIGMDSGVEADDAEASSGPEEALP